MLVVASQGARPARPARRTVKALHVPRPNRSNPLRRRRLQAANRNHVGDADCILLQRCDAGSASCALNPTRPDRTPARGRLAIAPSRSWQASVDLLLPLEARRPRGFVSRNRWPPPTRKDPPGSQPWLPGLRPHPAHHPRLLPPQEPWRQWLPAKLWVCPPSASSGRTHRTRSIIEQPREQRPESALDRKAPRCERRSRDWHVRVLRRQAIP